MSYFHFSDYEDTFQSLQKLHSEKHRAYHNCEHIEACLSHLNASSHLFEEPNAQKEMELAFWFHDAIYNPLKKDNELKSAELCSKFLSSQSADPKLINSTYELIMATRHSVPLKNEAEKIMVDIDLAVLGSTKSAYQIYRESVRKEYKWAPTFLYKKGRRKILQSFLDRTSIYQTAYFRDQWESNARSNLEREITELS